MAVQPYCEIVLTWPYYIIPVSSTLKNQFILHLVDGCLHSRNSLKYIHGLRKRRANIMHWCTKLVEKTCNLLTSLGVLRLSSNLKQNDRLAIPEIPHLYESPLCVEWFGHWSERAPETNRMQGRSKFTK